MSDRIKAHWRREGYRILGMLIVLGSGMVLIPLCAALLMVWMTGCTALMDRTPITETAVLQTSQPLAYQRATRALTQMGATIMAADARTGLLSAQVKNAVVLNVQVQPHAQGSQVTATGALMPDKIAFGSLTEVQDYMALLKALP